MPTMRFMTVQAAICPPDICVISSPSPGLKALASATIRSPISMVFEIMSTAVMMTPATKPPVITFDVLMAMLCSS